MKQIPNFFTLLNLFAGVLAIIFVLQTDTIIITQGDQMVTSFNIPEKLAWGSICILIAAVIDFLDGFVARLLKTTSELGKQLDSLSDVVSFGVAPSIILYQLLRLSYAREENGLYISIVALLPSILLACAAAYRLGKFNVSNEQQYSFKGVPVPAVGIFIASLPLILHYNNFNTLNGWIVDKWVLYGLIILLSYLMVSPHRMLALKFVNFRFKTYWPLVLLAVIAIAAAAIFGWVSVPVTFFFYILLSIISSKKVTT